MVFTSLDWTGVDYTLLILQTLSNGILGDDSFTSTRMRRNKHALITLNRMNRYLLEGVQSELVFARWFLWRHMLRNWYVRVAWRHRDLMSHLRSTLE